MNKWLLLGAAVLAEVAGTLTLRAALDKPVWLPVVAISYLAAFYCLGRTLRRGMPIGIAYGLWAACGVTLVALLGAVLFSEPLSLVSIIGIALIVLGVVTVETGSSHQKPGQEA